MSNGAFPGFTRAYIAFEKRVIYALLQFFGNMRLYRSMFS